MTELVHNIFSLNTVFFRFLHFPVLIKTVAEATTWSAQWRRVMPKFSNIPSIFPLWFPMSRLTLKLNWWAKTVLSLASRSRAKSSNKFSVSIIVLSILFWVLSFFLYKINARVYPIFNSFVIYHTESWSVFLKHLYRNFFKCFCW